MYRGYLQLGHTEIANSNRTITYARNGVRNNAIVVVTDDSWAHTPLWLGRDSAYLLPELDDDCPWYDPADSASAEFAGIWPMSIDGLDTNPLEREVVEGATAGGGFGVDRTPPRTITVEAVLVAKSPAGLQYGLGWLGTALRADDEDGPRNLTFLASAPPVDALATADNVERLAAAETRMVAQVAQTGQLTVEETFSPWAYENRGATCARVSFELTAGVPWIWRTPTTLATNIRPAYGIPQTVRFENVGPGGTLGPAGSDSALLVDPQSEPLVALPRPVSPAASVGLEPLRSRRTTWTLEAGRMPRWAETVPTITIRTGATEERSLRLQWVEGTNPDDATIAHDSVGEAMIGYLPANAACTLDAVTGEATVVTSDGRALDATPVVTGRWGGPWRSPVMRCSQAYTLVIDTLPDVNDAVRISIQGLVRQP